MRNDYRSKGFLREGYTLIELLVAVGLFLVVISIATGGFVNALRTQRQSASLVLANSNVSLVLEQISREMRTGANFVCSDGTTGGGEPITCSSGLTFINASGDDVSYCPDGSGGIVRALSSNCLGGQKITSDGVQVNYLKFRIFGYTAADNFPARITISLGISPKGVGVSGNIMNLETTVSARFLDG